MHQRSGAAGHPPPGQYLELLREIQERLHIAIIFITHDFGIVAATAHKVAVMSQEVYENPLHPYSQALLSAALPLHPSFRQSRIVLSGEVPSPLNPPSGCRFHPRCPLRMAICAEREPLLKEAAPGRLVACHAVNKPD